LGSPDGDPAALLWDLAVASRVPTKLADLVGSDGPLKRDDLAAVAEAAAAEVTSNPRPVSAEDLLELLEHAYDGVRP
jgi:alcohol dehydrogenase class IV